MRGKFSKLTLLTALLLSIVMTGCVVSFDNNVPTDTTTTTFEAGPDLTAPTVLITSPSDGGNVPSPFSIVGTVQDLGSPVTGVYISVDSGAYSLATGSTGAAVNPKGWVYNVATPYTHGTSLTIDYFAVDVSNNISVTNSINVNVVDYDGPVVEILSPENGDLVASTFEEIGFVFDTMSDIAEVFVKVDSGTWQNVNNSYDTTAGVTNYWTNDIVGMTYGVHTLYAAARDVWTNYGPTNSAQVLVPKQETEPDNDAHGTADTIVLRAPVYAAMNDGTDNDFYSITLTNGVTYEIQTYTNPEGGGTVDTAIDVFWNANLSTPVDGTDSVGGFETLNFTPASGTGIYFIRITDHGATGAYALRVNRL